MVYRILNFAAHAPSAKITAIDATEDSLHPEKSAETGEIAARGTQRMCTVYARAKPHNDGVPLCSAGLRKFAEIRREFRE